MSAQQLLLSWKDHNGALVSVFENLLKKNTLVDCTLAAEGQYLKAHRVVLSACSSYFELLFSQEGEKNPIVILKDVKFQELVAAVNFMYRGEVEVYEDRLAAFLEVADCLQIKGLGSDGKSQDSRKEVSPKKCPSDKSDLSERQWSRKEDSNPQRNNVGHSSNETAECEHIRNYTSSSVHQSSQRERSPITVSTCSSESSCTVSKKTLRDSHSLENVQQSFVIPFSRESIQSEDNSMLKTEPETDTFLEHQSNEDERDFEDDENMKSDQDDCDEPNTETMDVVPIVQQNFDYPREHIKTEDITSEKFDDLEAGNRSSSEGAGCILPDDHHNFSTIFVKEEPGTSASWNKEADIYGVSASGDAAEPSTVTSAASTGLDGIVNEDNWEPTSAFVQFYPPVIGRSQSKVSWESTDPSLQRSPSVTSSKKTICPHRKKLFSRPRDISMDLEKGAPSTNCSSLPVVSKIKHGPADISVTQPLSLQRSDTSSSKHSLFKCSVCKYVTLKRDNFTRHYRIHTGDKPFKCPHCDYASGQKGNVVKHLRIHTGEKPFKCPYCDYACKQGNHLTTHIATTHIATTHIAIHKKRFISAILPKSNSKH